MSEFMEARASVYEIDRGLCDLFGLNVTWNPGGYNSRRQFRIDFNEEE
jgi:cephalosporin hydroxylase